MWELAMKVIKEKTEILLMEYAAGALDEACALLAASYVTVCPEARRYLRECEHFGGALVETCDPVAMHGHSLKAVLGRLDESHASPACGEKARYRKRPVPHPVADHMDERGHRPRWLPMTRGLRYCSLPAGNSAHAATLIHCAPGAKAPRHLHSGDELTLVLTGGYSDEFGNYKAGDLVIAGDGTAHSPVAGKSEGCACIVVTQAPVRFTGGVYAILNIFMR